MDDYTLVTETLVRGFLLHIPDLDFYYLVVVVYPVCVLGRFYVFSHLVLHIKLVSNKFKLAH